MGTGVGKRMLSLSQGRVRLLTHSHKGGLCRTGRPPLSPGGQWVSPTPREYCSRRSSNAGPGQLAQGGMEGTLRHTVGVERSEAAWYHLRRQVPPCWEPEKPNPGPQAAIESRTPTAFPNYRAKLWASGKLSPQRATGKLL